MERMRWRGDIGACSSAPLAGRKINRLTCGSSVRRAGHRGGAINFDPRVINRGLIELAGIGSATVASSRRSVGKDIEDR